MRPSAVQVDLFGMHCMLARNVAQHTSAKLLIKLLKYICLQMYLAKQYCAQRNSLSGALIHSQHYLVAAQLISNLIKPIRTSL